MSSKSLFGRSLVELLVIVAGVLAALAADRWNQTRLDTEAADDYLQRLADDVRTDTAYANDMLRRLPVARASRDSLLAAVDGVGPLPDELRDAVFRAWQTLLFPAPVTWTELNSTGGAVLIADLDLRRAIVQYYTYRSEALKALESGEIRGRYPFVEAQYQIGILEDPAQPDAAESFVQWPGMRRLLIGLGGHYAAMEIYLPAVTAVASDLLTELQ